jgi:Rrf2 family protein
MSTLLSKKTDYALLVLSQLHASPNGVCARELSERFDLSKGFVANILKELCQKGFLTSQRGAKGGYVLQRPAEQITLAEILEALEDGLKLTSCNGVPHDEPHDCSVHAQCPIRGPMNEIHQRIFAVLRGITLAGLFRTNQSTTTFQPVLSLLNHQVPSCAELQEVAS